MPFAILTGYCSETHKPVSPAGLTCPSGRVRSTTKFIQIDTSRGSNAARPPRRGESENATVPVTPKGGKGRPAVSVGCSCSGVCRKEHSRLSGQDAPCHNVAPPVNTNNETVATVAQAPQAAAGVVFAMVMLATPSAPVNTNAEQSQFWKRKRFLWDVFSHETESQS